VKKLNQYWDQNNVQQIIDGNGNFLLLERNFIEGSDNVRFYLRKEYIKMDLKRIWTGNSLHQNNF
jgi:hypothetical protein